MRTRFVLGEVVAGLRRNVTMTLAMILTTAIMLTMLGGGLLLIQMADKSKKVFLDRVEMQVYLLPDVTAADPDCADDPCVSLKADLQAEPGVTSVTYISQDQALATAQENWRRQSPDTVDLLRKEAFPASLRVRVDNPSRFDSVIDKYRGAAGVENIGDQRKLVQRLFSVLDGARNAAFAVSAILAVAAILLIVNMVQIAAYTRRTEVAIMRLVGATRWYTQLPFLLEAVFSAIIGAALAVGALFIGRVFFFERALEGLYGVNILARISVADVWFVAPWLLLAGVVLAGATAYGTLRVYVRE